MTAEQYPVGGEGRVTILDSSAEGDMDDSAEEMDDSAAMDDGTGADEGPPAEQPTG